MKDFKYVITFQIGTASQEGAVSCIVDFEKVLYFSWIDALNNKRENKKKKEKKKYKRTCWPW